MTRVVVMPTARARLDRLIETHSLPGDTARRVAHSVRPLRRFPMMGKQLAGRWAAYRYIFGPWRWMIVIYSFDEANDTVSIITILDGRSAESTLETADRP